jgi:hypothetical protein
MHSVMRQSRSPARDAAHDAFCYIPRMSKRLNGKTAQISVRIPRELHTRLIERGEFTPQVVDAIRLMLDLDDATTSQAPSLQQTPAPFAHE